MPGSVLYPEGLQARIDLPRQIVIPNWAGFQGSQWHFGDHAIESYSIYPKNTIPDTSGALHVFMFQKYTKGCGAALLGLSYAPAARVIRQKRWSTVIVEEGGIPYLVLDDHKFVSKAFERRRCRI